MCKECAKGQAGVYGFDFGGVSGELMTVGATFGGYVAAQTVDNTVSFLKNNPQTSGWVWTGLSLGLNMMFPDLAGNRYVQAMTVGAGVYGLKRLNQHYNFLKGINGILYRNQVNGVDYGAEYTRRLQEAANRALPDVSKPMEQILRPVQSLDFRTIGMAA